MHLKHLLTSTVLESIQSVLPEEAVKKALLKHPPQGKVVLVAIGKAAWRMAKAASETLGTQIIDGCVITKDGHSQGPIAAFKIFEAAHPVPEMRNLEASRYALDLVKGLAEQDTVLFLVSGGGSALFELPLDGVSLEDLIGMTQQLLSSGASVVDINTLRKRISSLKGGRFAQQCLPAHIQGIVLSDVLGDRLDSIASGPASPDSSTCSDALGIVEKYKLKLPRSILDKLNLETPKHLDNVEMQITGSVSVLCEIAADSLRREGYEPFLLTTTLDCEAASAGFFFAALAREALRQGRRRVAFVAGGETVVKVKGKGKGGRCQEMALAAALGMQGLSEAAFIAAGSDGTDGPTDAAGGIVDGQTFFEAQKIGLNFATMLDDNNAYHALQAVGGLFVTGPTGTNVNDLVILAIDNTK